MTKPLIVRFAWGTVIATLLVALALGAFLLWGLPDLLPPGSAIIIDGERIEIGNLTPTHPGQWVMASIGVASILTGAPSRERMTLIRPENACPTASTIGRSRLGPLWPQPETDT